MVALGCAKQALLKPKIMATNKSAECNFFVFIIYILVLQRNKIRAGIEN